MFCSTSGENMAEHKDELKDKHVAEKTDKSLEDIFQDLEQVITRLESEDVSLEQSFQFYEKGMKLLQEANVTIDVVEKQVQLLDEQGGTHDF